ncbi:hypothetical protein [Planomicrobium okeanokoites]|uniref:Uncharacterized protein n=1 Tax=Planomicrobium okeanokoites TaxID=244 RepID=A0ABV7KPG0_PLAOK|nr:hypothetical protein [Planomicrobium okeanokoites]TAA71379.1 hypothetical protein D2910_03620 [Planomicrobium okeanokoites]
MKQNSEDSQVTKLSASHQESGAVLWNIGFLAFFLNKLFITGCLFIFLSAISFPIPTKEKKKKKGKHSLCFPFILSDFAVYF